MSIALGSAADAVLALVSETERALAGTDPELPPEERVRQALRAA